MGKLPPPLDCFSKGHKDSGRGLHVKPCLAAPKNNVHSTTRVFVIQGLFDPFEAEGCYWLLKAKIELIKFVKAVKKNG